MCLPAAIVASATSAPTLGLPVASMTTSTPSAPRRGQHFIGLADAGRGAEKDLQAAPLRLLHFTQECVG